MYTQPTCKFNKIIELQVGGSVTDQEMRSSRNTRQADTGIWNASHHARHWTITVL